MKDFSLQTYQLLLSTLQKEGYSMLLFKDWCKKQVSGRVVLLRHDIDKKPENSIKIALLENKLGVKSTFNFLADSSVFKPDIIREIASLGHEIAYHYRDLVDAKGNFDKAIALFELNLNKFRQISEVETISMDGCPWSKYDNRDLWKKYNYHDFGIIGEPYFDFLNRDDVLYFTDTGRMWNGDKYNVRDKVIIRADISLQKKFPRIHSTFDMIQWIEKSDNQAPIMISTHPQRWTDNKIAWYKELIVQTIKNQFKTFIRR